MSLAMFTEPSFVYEEEISPEEEETKVPNALATRNFEGLVWALLL